MLTLYCCFLAQQLETIIEDNEEEKVALDHHPCFTKKNTKADLRSDLSLLFLSFLIIIIIVNRLNHPRPKRIFLFFLSIFPPQFLATLNTTSSTPPQHHRLQQQQQTSSGRINASTAAAASAAAASEKAKSTRIEALKSDSRDFPAAKQARKYHNRRT